jgi:hypothetical protein
MIKEDYIYYSGDPKEYNQKYEQWEQENPGVKVIEITHTKVDLKEGKMMATIKYKTAQG